MSGSRISRELLRALIICSCPALCPHALKAASSNHPSGQYIITNWPSRDSFPGGAINAIAQTPEGYLWIGAENGLVRFDGIRFQLIDHSNAPSLPAGQILGLVVDSSGALWVRMESPNLMRYRDGSFEQMYAVSRLESGVTAIARDASGSVLIAPSGLPQRFTGKFTPLVNSGAFGGLALSIAETPDGVIWVGMPSGLFCVRAGRESPISGLPDQKVNVLLPGTGSELWIGTDAGLVRWDGSSVTRRGIPSALARSPILALARDRDSNLWISTPAGVVRLDPNGSLTHGLEGSRPGTVHAIFEDREGSLWLGGTEGLVQLRSAPFVNYESKGGSLYVDASGRAWVGAASGGLLWMRGPEHHSVTGDGLDHDVIYSISGGPGEVWVGRRHGGVTQLREENGAIHLRSYTAADGLAPGVISAVHRGRDGTVWAGALSGAVSRIQNSRVTNFTTANGLSADAITTIEETPDGVIWAGTAGGIEAFRDGNWRRYGGEDGLPPGRVNSLAVDGDGVLWAGTSGGLFYWSGTQFENAHNTPDSLLGEIYGLAADGVGNLWAAANRRVVRISRASLLNPAKTPAAVREFTAADGLPSTRGIWRDHSVSKDAAGRIWLSFQGGFYVFNPLQPAALAPARVNMESVEVDDRPLGAGPAARYPSSRHRIVFNFTGVSLAVPGRVRYRYLLDGFDRDWSPPTESRQAAYTNLPPSRYIFRVMASNSEGMWNGASANVPFEVEPQLSQTWWFRLAVACLAAAGVFIGVRHRLARIRAGMSLQFEARLLERTRIARELHDTLLQSFHGLMLRLQLVEDLLPEGKAKEQLQQTLERADEAIEEGRSAVYDLRSSALTSNDLAETLKALGDELATEESSFRLIVEGPPRDLHPVIRDEVYRIAREALRNAFGHAQPHHVETELTFKGRALQLRIRDDGAGIPPELLVEGRPGHYGLRGMRERAKQIGAKLDIWTGAGTGTEIELNISGSIAYIKSAGQFRFRLSRKKRSGGT